MLAQAIEPPQKIRTTSSFIGLKFYTEEQADIFFGRDDEIKSLYKLIKTNTLTILFGKSGTGKTSLLNAGVFPRLRENYCLPFRIRLEFLDNSPDLLTQIKQVLKSQIDKYGFKVESYPSTETLWEYFHREQLWKIITPILIFDQFEEIFTLAGKSIRFKKQELDVLITELSDLIENSIPEKLKDEFINSKEDVSFNYQKQKAKIIFSFREDFLPEMESITGQIPSVKNSRFRLMPMNGKQAYEVITKTWKNAIDPAEANKIVYFLTNETETDGIHVETSYGKYEIIEVEPSLLSQVCSFIDKERINEGQEKISAEFLKKYSKGIILRSLYDQALSESKQALNLSDYGDEKKTGNAIKEFIEDNLITDEGYRTKFALAEINEKIRPGIEVLKRKYFIREEGDSIELTHDVIVTLVKSDREERRKEAALANERKKAKKKMRLVVILASLAVISFWGFLAWPAYLTKTSLEKDQRNLMNENHDITKIIDSLKKVRTATADSIEKEKRKTKTSAAGINNSGPDSLTNLKIDSLNNMVNLLKGINSGKSNKEKILNESLSNTNMQNKRILSDLDKLQNQLYDVNYKSKTRAAYTKMYQTHIDSIIDYSRDSAILQYHIRLIKQHRDSFSKKLEYPN